jgi:phosphohistidine phosphatase
MKKLYVIRHAKSSWDNTDVPDLERPLNDRGKRDAPRMGKRLKEKDVHPDMLLSSHANRAYATCTIIAQVLGCPKDLLKTDKRLYHSNENTILNVLKGLNDKVKSIMIFGHNPGLTDFTNSLSDEGFVTNNIPTCGVVIFDIGIDSWKDIEFGRGHLLFFDFPKSKDD